jgi:diadenosine tetraphosphate (Ap4A) HIT family hydrolase
MSDATPCPFCSLPPERIVLENAVARCIRDAYPVSPGHTLIIPRRHMGSVFEARSDEWAGIGELLERARRDLDGAFRPAAYNIGINDGPAAGQTVPHLHVHLIPRYAGDCADPRGGIRWLFPDKADYWSARRA